MPRRSRIDAAGALHYVMTRGIERGEVFSSETDCAKRMSICWNWYATSTSTPFEHALWRTLINLAGTNTWNMGHW